MEKHAVGERDEHETVADVSRDERQHVDRAVGRVSASSGSLLGLTDSLAQRDERPIWTLSRCECGGDAAGLERCDDDLDRSHGYLASFRRAASWTKVRGRARVSRSQASPSRLTGCQMDSGRCPATRPSRYRSRLGERQHAGGSLVWSADRSLTLRANNTFVLQPSDYLIGATAGNPDLCLCWPRASPPSADGIDWQLGTPFLRTVYSVWRCVTTTWPVET